MDVTNYVMIELGRPLHVYDLDKLQDGIDVRFGRVGERLKLLNEQSVDVDETVLCITDASGPIGLAGIMGGDSTKAETDSRNIFLESAFFFPDAIAGRPRRCGPPDPRHALIGLTGLSFYWNRRCATKQK